MKLIRLGLAAISSIALVSAGSGAASAVAPVSKASPSAVVVPMSVKKGHLTGSDIEDSCSKLWTSNTYGGTSKIHAWADASASSPVVTFHNIHASVYGMIDCGPGGNTITAAKAVISMTFKIVGTSLTSCSDSLSISSSPSLSVSCTATTTTNTIHLSRTCTNTSDCYFDAGPLSIDSDGGNFNSIYMSATTVLYGPASYTYGLVQRTSMQLTGF